jgi:GR25 family glycosyltransferase involved in LPS biosynthesis
MEINNLYNEPSFIVSLDRCIDRYHFAKNNVEQAGFKDIIRFKGVDAKVDNLSVEWAKHGNPPFNMTHNESANFIEYKGKQGCMLSHLNLWKHIIDNKIKIATIFEDDVRFHSQWNEYAPQYLKNTPTDYDILYIGSQIEAQSKTPITIIPVYCTHAYIITYEGAQKLYNILMNMPGGIYTIDMMLIDIMWKVMYTQNYRPFIWYVWNGNMIPDNEYKTIDPSKQKRNQGLVFQDDIFESEVRQYEFGKS